MTKRQFIYSWQDKEGHRHEGVMEAPNKDAVYALLRSKGIRAIKVTERIVPVVKNSFSGLRKRDWVSLLIIFLVLLVALVPFLYQKPDVKPRHFLDIPEGVVLTNVFERGCDAYLAQFAVPGMTNLVGQVEWLDEYEVDLSKSVLLRDNKEEWQEELRKVVGGIKAEAVSYLRISGGALHFIDHLKERQAMEHARLTEMLRKVYRKEISLGEANATLRGLGLQLPPHESDADK